MLATGDVDFAVELWPVVEKAMTFVLRWQLADGTIRWSLDAQGRPETYALLTGSSSIFHSLCCGVALAERLDLREARVGTRRGAPRSRRGASPGRLRPEERVRHGLVLPDLLRSASRSARRKTISRRVGAPRDGRSRRALRLDERLGDGGRDGGVRAGARRTRTHQSGPRPLRLHSTASTR